MGRAIVFGTTLEPGCRQLAEVAALFARRLGAQLRLMHVSEDPRAPVVLGTDEEHLLGPVRVELEREAQRLREFAAVDVHAHLAAGSVVDALVSLAELELASALLLGGGMQAGRALLGATAERAARKSAVPVFALRETDRLLAWLRAERPLRVLVGADLGRAAEAARAFAVALGRLGPTQSEIVLVVSPPELHERLSLAPPASPHALSAEAEEILLRDLSATAPPGEVDVTLRVLPARGSADAHLVGLADQGNFDLVVVGRRRTSLLEQLWYGSVGRGVLRAAPVSVACVPTALAAPTPGYRPPGVVLIGTDFTEVAEVALSQALGLVAEGGTLHLAHVLPPAPRSELDTRRAREQAWYALSKLLGDDVAGEGETRRERHVLVGEAADQLLALADRVGADLIVLGARGPSVVRVMSLGSVARAISERARVPVLLVPAPTS